MRYLIISVALFCVSCFIGACSNDDKMANIVVPPLADDTLMIPRLKLVDTIRMEYVFENGGRVHDFLYFTYDEQHSISQIRATEGGDTVDVNFAYVPGQMTLNSTNEKGARIYTLNDGIAWSMYKKDGTDDMTNIVYIYDNENHLIKVMGNYIAADFIYKDTTVFEWQEGNMVSYRLRDFCNVPDYMESSEGKFWATAALNNYNIDLNAVLLETLLAVDVYNENPQGISRYTDYAGIVGIYGKKSKNILEYEGYRQQQIVDKEGYITKIITSSDDGMVTTVTISYR